MAIIVVEVPKEGFVGESSVPGYEDQIDALGIREAIELTVSQIAGSSRSSGGGLVGRIGDIELTRYHDSASPKFAEACSAATDIGDVTIRLFRTTEMGPKVYMAYTLTSTYISRVERMTLDEAGVMLMPTFNPAVRGAPPPASSTGLASLVAPLLTTQKISTQELVRSTAGIQPGMPTNRELERIWLNANAITWTYTPYVGAVAQGPVERTHIIRG